MAVQRDNNEKGMFPTLFCSFVTLLPVGATASEVYSQLMGLRLACANPCPTNVGHFIGDCKAFHFPNDCITSLITF